MSKQKSLFGVLRVALLTALFAISAVSLFGFNRDTIQAAAHLGPCQSGHLYFLSGGSHTGPCYDAVRYRIVIAEEETDVTSL